MIKYSSYTYEHKNFIVRYPHLRRLEIVSRSIRQLAPKSWLDYGAGDGAVFKHLALRYGLSDTQVVLYEPDPEMREQLFENIAGITNVNFRVVGDMDDVVGTKFDVVTALEVLEHLPMPERTKFYQYLTKHLALEGSCLIEVPIEYGPVLFLKEFGRRFLKNRKSEYSIYELFLTGLLSITLDSKDRYNAEDTRTFIIPHQGFDLHKLFNELSKIGELRIAKNSPFPYLPRWVNQCTLISFKPLSDNGRS